MAIGTHKPTKETIWKTCYDTPPGTKYDNEDSDNFSLMGQYIFCDGKQIYIKLNELFEPDVFLGTVEEFSLKNWFSKSPKYPIRIKDKQDIFWALSFKGKWKKRFCNKLDLDNISYTQKVLRQRKGETNVGEYTDTRIIFGKYYRKEVGGKILFRREIFRTFKTYEPIF